MLLLQVVGGWSVKKSTLASQQLNFSMRRGVRVQKHRDRFNCFSFFRVYQSTTVRIIEFMSLSNDSNWCELCFSCEHRKMTRRHNATTPHSPRPLNTAVGVDKTRWAKVQTFHIYIFCCRRSVLSLDSQSLDVSKLDGFELHHFGLCIFVIRANRFSIEKIVACNMRDFSVLILFEIE